jgi:hypothetical protein
MPIDLTGTVQAPLAVQAILAIERREDCRSGGCPPYSSFRSETCFIALRSFFLAMACFRFRLTEGFS